MTGFVYAIGDGRGRVKIGWSQDPMRRIGKIASDCPSKVSLLGLIPATIEQEQQAHALLAPWRVNREWFALEGVVAAFVQMLPKPRPRSLRTEVRPGDHPLRVWRKTNNLTLEQLGEMVGVERPTVNRWEHSVRVPSRQHMRRLIEITGLSPSVFYGGAA